MKAWKINLKDYEVPVEVKQEDGTTKKVPIKYQVKKSIEAILFNPELKLGGRELILQNKLFEKIEKEEDEILLDTDDYHKLKQACEKVQGYQKADVILVERVLEAPEVEVEEKTEGKKGK